MVTTIYDIFKGTLWMKMFVFWVKCYWNLVMLVKMTTALAQVIGSAPNSGKPLSETMMADFTNAYTRDSALMDATYGPVYIHIYIYVCVCVCRERERRGGIYTETEMLSFWWNFNHWLHRKLSFWQLSVQPVMKISSKWRHFCFSDMYIRELGYRRWWPVACSVSWTSDILIINRIHKNNLRWNMDQSTQISSTRYSSKDNVLTKCKSFANSRRIRQLHFVIEKHNF